MNMTAFAINKTRSDIEKLRIIQSNMNFIEFDYSDATSAYKKGLISNYWRIRSPKIIEVDHQMSFIQGVQEFLDGTYELSAENSNAKGNYTFDTLIFTYDNTNSSNYGKTTMPLVGLQMY